MKKLLSILVALLVVVGLAPSASAVSLLRDPNPRTAVAVVYPNGAVQASANGYEARPALSLSKLYLGYWVLYHGAPEHKAMVEHMIRVSDDGIASILDRAYPGAIGSIASDFAMNSTHRNGYWGNSSTSAVDAARFVSLITPDPVAAPVLRGMATASPIAADGFPQNYGTSLLPGVQGTKYGWSDDRTSSTGTVSYGQGFTAAALTYGPASANTEDALYAFGGGQGGPAGLAAGTGTPASSLGSSSVPMQPAKNLLPAGTPAEVAALVPDDLLVPAGLPQVTIPQGGLPRL